MTVIAVRKDAEQLTLTLDAEFDATPERVWQLWADPRKLERWWGPPGYPATFTQHDFRAGGRSVYHMTGPDGPTSNAYWEILELDPPRSIRLEDGFATDGAPAEFADMKPGGMIVTIEPIDGGRTRMTMLNTFADVETMEQLLAMGQEEGMREALGQVDAILAEDAPAGVAR